MHAKHLKGTYALVHNMLYLRMVGWLRLLLLFFLSILYMEQRTSVLLLLILVGHVSPTSVATIKLAQKKTCIMKLPAHCFDVLQLLDVYCFAPLNNEFKTALNDHVHKTGAREPLRNYGFVNMLCSV